ncbi:MAG TPA: NADP-dependent malic enzyme [Rhodocyclaceae bacterium]|nr:NADP-dependent malic enzyme [Rhodocyclaceae bacterium]
MDDDIRAAALDYHASPRPGKIAVVPTKSLTNQHELSLAYTPGVAVACMEISSDPAEASRLTGRANMVAVVTNGTAVLGLGNIGPLAAKPVMEGKAVLFKKFAGIDVFDLELAQSDPDKLIDAIAALEPTFGGINLEDIKAPECFYIEQKLRERMKIPVFHDDQHGTAIVVCAAILNGLKVVGKELKDVKLVTSGAGAAALACLALLRKMGLPLEHIWVTDIDGVVHAGRARMNDSLEPFARATEARTLADVIADADVFLGLSAGGVLKPEMVARMARSPLILALANPVPEILPDMAKSVRADVVMATGRSDFPNQVNNSLCFPFIFRGALDVGATTINDEMKIAACTAIAELAHAEHSDVVAAAYHLEDVRFGADYLMPKQFDPRLITRVAPAVAQAAMDSGVATRPIADMMAYVAQLEAFVYHSSFVMKPVFSGAKANPARVIFAEGEEERVLRAVKTVVDDGLAKPVVIGRPEVVQLRIERAGLRLRPGIDFEMVNQDSDPRYKELWQSYYQIMQRKGVSVEMAKRDMLRRPTVIGAMLMRHGYADAMLCGSVGSYAQHLEVVGNVLGKAPGVGDFYAMNMLILPDRTLFIADTYVHYDPSVEQIVEMTLLAAEELRRFGLTPKVALLSHSSFGTAHTPTAQKMRAALASLNERAPELEVEGEMHGDAALSATIRQQVFPDSRLRGEANLLIMPNLDAANIAFNLLKEAAGDGVTVGPILLGAARPVHIVTPTASVRRLLNMTALLSVETAQQKSRKT